MSYNIETYLPQAPDLVNSGIPLPCPLCGEDRMWVYLPGGLPCMVLQCYGCRFFGNVVQVHSRLEDIPYSVALTEWDGPAGECRDFPKILSRIEETNQLLRVGQENLQADTAWAQDLLRHAGCGVDLRRTAAITRRLALLERSDIAGTWLDNYAVPNPPILAIPYLLCPNVCVRLRLIWGDSQMAARVLGEWDYNDGGVLWFSGATEAVVEPDLFRALELVQQYCTSGRSHTIPIVTADSGRSFQCWGAKPWKKLWVRIEDGEMPSYINRLKHRSGARFVSGGPEKFRKTLFESGTERFLRQVDGESASLPALLAGSSGDEKRLDEAEKNLELFPGEFRSLISRCSREQREALSSHWPEIGRTKPFVDGSYRWELADNGALLRIHRHSERVEQVASASLDIERCIVGPETTRMLGHMRIRDRSFPFDTTESVLLGREMKSYFRRLAVEGNLEISGISVSTTQTKWLSACEGLSRPISVKGYERVTMDPEDGLILPGLRILPGSVRRDNRLTTPHSDLLSPSEGLGSSDVEYWEESDEAEFLWTCGLLMSVALCQRLDGQVGGLIALAGPGASVQERAEEVFGEVGMSGPATVVPGYPQTAHPLEEGGLRICTAWAAHALLTGGDYHYAILPELRHETGLPMAPLFFTICEALASAQAEHPSIFEGRDILRQAIDVVEVHVTERLGLPSAPVSSAGRRLRFRSLTSVPGRDVSGAGYRVLEAACLCERSFRSDAVQIGEESVALDLPRLAGVLEERSGGSEVTLDPAALREFLERDRLYIGGRLSSALVSREQWDKVQNRWARQVLPAAIPSRR